MMYRVQGNEARNSSQFRRAIENHTAALEAAYAVNDTINITVVMNDLATDFRRIGAFDEAAPYRKMKTMTGKTLLAFTMDVRMKRAEAMLSNGNRNITEVALACGLSDLGYFSRSFKGAFGCAPSQ